MKRTNLTLATIGGSTFDVVRPMPVQTGTDALNRIEGYQFKSKSNERDWQEAAYAYARAVPEIGQAIEHTANTVKSCRLTVLEETDAGDMPVEFGSPGDVTLKALVSEMSDSYDEILFAMARALQTAGECWFIGRAVDGNESENGLIWEVYSVREVTSTGDNWEILTADGKETLNKSDIVDRLYRPDAEFRFNATSPMQRVLSLCSQLLLLEQNVKAVAESRLSAQVWYMPEDVTLHTVDESQASATGKAAKMNPVVRKFLEHASAPLTNPDSAARLVPLVMTGPVDGKERMGIIDVSRAPDAIQAVLREEVILRIARGLDIPIEVIFGMGDTNHWTSYGISAQFLGDHIEPLGNRIAAFLTRKYLRPMLQAGYDMTAEEAMKFKFKFDTSPVTSRVDDGPATRAAFDRGEASAERYRASIGLSEADAPNEEEMARRDARRLLTSASVTYGPQVLKFLYPDIPEIQELAEALIEDQANRGSADPDQEEDGKPESEDEGEDKSDDSNDDGGGPEDSQDEPETSDNVEASILFTQLMTAADRDCRRALARASSRLVSKARAPRNSDILGRVNATTNKNHIVANVSDADLSRLKVTRASLIDGAFEDLRSDVERWVFDFVDDGSRSLATEGKAIAVADNFASKVREFTLAALSKPVKTTAGSIVPPEVILATLERL